MKLKAILFLLLSMLLCSCSSNDTPMPLSNVEKSPEVLTGEYIASSQVGDVKLTFRKDSTVNYSASELSETEQLEGSYILSDDKLIIKNGNGDKLEAIYNKKDDTVTIEDMTLARNTQGK